MLLIDLDNTLIDRQAAFDRWAAVFLDELDRLEPGELTWLASVDRDGIAPREEFFRHVRERYSLNESIETLASTYRSVMPTLIPSPSRSTLAALRTARESGFKTCIVTNGSRAGQEPKVRLHLAGAVDGWVISGEIGVRKPDPAILRAAATICGEALSPSSWMIGDRPETDILGACRAGIRSAWVTRGSRWDEHLDYRPSLEADSFPEAVQRILESHVGRSRSN
jgi:putative hydrolase of the HAD superfamily